MSQADFFQDRLLQSTYPQYKLLMPLVMLYVSVMLTSMVLFGRIVTLHMPFTKDLLLISGSLFPFPLLYFLGDFIAEVYGFRIAKNLIWSSILAELFFVGMTLLVIHLPAPGFMHNYAAYIKVLNANMRYLTAAIIAIFSGTYINAYILTKLKFRFKGKGYPLRSFFATAAGEFVNTILAFVIAYFGQMPVDKIIDIVLTAYMFKMIYAFIGVPLAACIVYYIKRIEQVDTYDNQ